MTKKLVFLSLLIGFSVTFIGCETSRGMIKGGEKFVEESATGFKKDWERAEKIDNWMQENLW